MGMMTNQNTRNFEGVKTRKLPNWLRACGTLTSCLHEITVANEEPYTDIKKQSTAHLVKVHMCVCITFI